MKRSRLYLTGLLGLALLLSACTQPPPPTNNVGGGDCPPPAALTQTLGLELDEPKGWEEVEARRVPGRILVRLTPGVSSLSLPVGVESLESPRPGWLVLATPEGKESEIGEQLLASGQVNYAQPVYRYKLLYTPNDQYFTYQKGQFELMGLTAAWDRLLREACRPKVAVVDTGADTDHEDLKANLLGGYDFTKSSSEVKDVDGHGTMVTGIIGAVTKNLIGVAGSTGNLAWVVPLKVFGDDGSGTSEDIAKAIDYARTEGYHLINLSLCILSDEDKNNDGHYDCANFEDNPKPDAFIEEALKDAYRAGLIAVAASGNDGLNYVGYPASSPYTIAVGSVGLDGKRSSFSNYSDLLDFVAPGEDVTSTLPDNRYSIPTAGFSWSGTSFATPYVTGVLALYLGQYYAEKGALPSFSQAYPCLKNNTNQTDWNEETGHGVPQADQVLDTTNDTCYP